MSTLHDLIGKKLMNMIKVAKSFPGFTCLNATNSIPVRWKEVIRKNEREKERNSISLACSGFRILIKAQKELET